MTRVTQKGNFRVTLEILPSGSPYVNALNAGRAAVASEQVKCKARQARATGVYSGK